MRKIFLLAGVICLQTYAFAQSPEIEMVFVQGGTFTMGCTFEQGGDCESNENPSHQVTVNSFNIGKYEVTQAQWELVMGYNFSSFKGDNQPVNNVSWDDVQIFISILNDATGKNYRLPTEAEWEYAARGGSKSSGYKYSGSDDINDVARFDGDIDDSTHPVGTKQPNELGIYDMSGNVWEWCSDWLGDYSASAQQDPTGVSSGSNRVLRGGGWFSTARNCRVAGRSGDSPSVSDDIMGFRLVLP
jgi:formylglycine-generating enzyme required for sulfatase activity